MLLSNCNPYIHNFSHFCYQPMISNRHLSVAVIRAMVLSTKMSSPMICQFLCHLENCLEIIEIFFLNTQCLLRLSFNCDWPNSRVKLIITHSTFFFHTIFILCYRRMAVVGVMLTQLRDLRIPQTHRIFHLVREGFHPLLEHQPQHQIPPPLPATLHACPIHPPVSLMFIINLMIKESSSGGKFFNVGQLLLKISR